ncbi:MFS general substrate transporter [Polyplosphaeria fusca]|uniref:MFS general substrate transporter n=1 Tax=Polyplosphaeria fusca TaxID=682080 RepID=A0A9P4QZC0_9PLEO|nr:MFS general substrate transporter [Polyplosphaeria fusca]
MHFARRLQFRWFRDDDSPEERKHVSKLDLLIIPYCFVAYWTKYIDQSNLNNAYVAGLKEDLHFEGNQLVRLQSIYLIGGVLGLLPFMYLFTRVPMHYLVPCMDITWGIFTFLQYRVHGFAELAAYRFMVGWCEAAYFPAIQYILGSWYREDEIARRGGIFFLGLTLGTLTSALIQSAASANLDGVNGLAGWRWMYIICALITIPIGMLGFLILPGTPDQPNRLVMKEHDTDIAVQRLKRAGHGKEIRATVQDFIKVIKNVRIWPLLLVDALASLASLNAAVGGFALWLKSLHRYSPSRITALVAIPPALGIFYTLLVAFASDLIVGPAWAITISHTWNIIGLIILIIWRVPEASLWFAFFTTYSSVAVIPVIAGWVNSQFRYSPAERSIALLVAYMLGQSTAVWTPLLVFKTVEAPQFTKGYPFVLGSALLMILTAHVAAYNIKHIQRSTLVATEQS